MNELGEKAFVLAERLGIELLARHWRLALAESCTGGGVSAAVTEVSGSSHWFESGFVVYSNDAKHRLLGVSEAVIEQEGAVSQTVVEALVQGLFAHTTADIGAAISGVAGPTGGTPTKPVGTVWFAFGRRNGPIDARVCHFPGDRQEVRQQAVCYCLQGLLERVSCPY